MYNRTCSLDAIGLATILNFKDFDIFEHLYEATLKNFHSLLYYIKATLKMVHWSASLPNRLAGFEVQYQI